MKVSDVGSTQRSSSTRRKGQGRGAADQDFADLLREAAESPAAQGSAPAGPAGAIESLLSIQEVGATDPDGKRRRSRDHGEQILDRLDELRHGLLLGEVSKDRLLDLARLVRSRREETDDPRLAEVLDEIELRAQVEIAKLTRG